MIVELKPRENGGSLTGKPKVIPCQAHNREGVETIPKGSTLKRAEARGVIVEFVKNIVDNDEEIVLSVLKNTAEDKMICKECKEEKEPKRVIWLGGSCHKKIHLVIGQSLAKIAEN